MVLVKAPPWPRIEWVGSISHGASFVCWGVIHAYELGEAFQGWQVCFGLHGNSPERFPITIHRTWILWVFGLRPRIKFIPPQKSSNFHSIKLETNINIAFWLRKIEIYLGFLKNLNIILLFCNLIYSLPFTDYLTTNMEIKKLLIIHKRKKPD